jgi:hypothetical protein
MHATDCLSAHRRTAALRGRRAQELLDAVAWLRANPERAEWIAANGRAWAQKYMTHEALDCRWLMLLREYNKLLVD